MCVLFHSTMYIYQVLSIIIASHCNLIFQRNWSGGTPAGLINWFSRPRALQSIMYTFMIQRRKKHFTKHFYWGTSEELQYISHGKQNYTAHHYKTIRLAKKLDILETLAYQYANPALRDVIGKNE